MKLRNIFASTRFLASQNTSPGRAPRGARDFAKTENWICLYRGAWPTRALSNATHKRRCKSEANENRLNEKRSDRRRWASSHMVRHEIPRFTRRIASQRRFQVVFIVTYGAPKGDCDESWKVQVNKSQRRVASRSILIAVNPTIIFSCDINYPSMVRSPTAHSKDSTNTTCTTPCVDVTPFRSFFSFGQLLLNSIAGSDTSARFNFARIGLQPPATDTLPLDPCQAP